MEQPNHPIMLGEVQVKLEDINYWDPFSGWREDDSARQDQLRVDFLGGKWDLTVGAQLRLLKNTDGEGRRYVDDGKQTLTVLASLQEKYRAGESPGSLVSSDQGDICEWDKKLVRIFENGLQCQLVEYTDDSKDARIVYQAGRHMQENNRVRYTPLYILWDLGKKTLTRFSNDRNLAERHLILQYVQKGPKARCIVCSNSPKPFHSTLKKK